ncbi:MAG TPA: DUF2207 domain-containing protein, partial [Bacteroidia bacterium]|nr:DUF2207 domain-containing protein [Bacteroidia bacterium]
MTETIKVVAKGIDIRRGIFRVLPENKSKSNPLKDVSYEIVSVKRDGKEEPYHLKNENSNTVVYIGEKNEYLDPGIYVYELQYKSSNHVGFFKDYDELYWNVTGNEWSFHIDSVSATIHLPASAKILQQSCYTGYAGSTNTNCASQKLSDTEISWSAVGLNSNEGLTVAVGFPKNIIAPPPPPGFGQKYALLLFAIIVVFLLLIYYFFTWNKYGKDPEAPAVYPIFESPDAISPAILGYVDAEYFKNDFVTASIVNLAVKGYLKINEKENKVLFGLIKDTDYSLTKLKNADSSLPTEEAMLLNKLFSSSSELSLTGTYDPNIKNAVTAYTDSIKSQYSNFINKGNNFKLIVAPSVMIALAIILISIFDAMMIDRLLPLFVIAIFGTVSLFIISFIFGFMGKRFYKTMWLIAILEMGLLLYLSYHILYIAEDHLENNLTALAIVLLFGAASIMFYTYLIRKPSAEKLKLQSQIKGFGMYLSAAEEEQLKFFNSPKMTPEIFEKFLPFAMVLGADKIWGEKFDNMLKSAS